MISPWWRWALGRFYARGDKVEIGNTSGPSLVAVLIDEAGVAEPGADRNASPLREIVARPVPFGGHKRDVGEARPGAADRAKARSEMSEQDKSTRGPEHVATQDPSNHLHLVAPTPRNRSMVVHQPPVRGVPGCPICRLIVRSLGYDE